MSTTPPGDQPSFADENAMRIASESLTNYDEDSDTYHCSYGPPIPALSVHDPERDVIVRVEPSSGQVVGFSIPNFKTWHATHADDDGSFEVELPSVWTLDPTDATDEDA